MQFVQLLQAGIPPPVANAGADQNITTPNTTLNGSGSTQSGGTIVSYFWEIISGEGAVIVSPNSAITPVVNINAAGGTYVFRLTVTNNEGGTNSDNVSVTTSFVNAGSSFSTKNRYQ